MNFCILRAKKLTTMGSIAGSAKHTFREIPTPNADSARTHLNWTAGAKTSEEICAAIKKSLPGKRRKDAVLCIEYLITASPEWLRTRTEKERIEYFNGAIAWLRKRHGVTNIVCINLQRDELSEHLVVYTTALTRDGRLSAKDFLGGRAKLTAMQTDFWKQVGKPVGLQRGLERSTAKHITAKQYSAAVAQNPTMRPPVRPQPSISDRLSGRAKDMEEAHVAAEVKYAELMMHATNEVRLMRNARIGRSLEVAKLRADKEELIVLKEKARTLADENGRLRKLIERQTDTFRNQIGALRLLLNQATARISELMTIIGKRLPRGAECLDQRQNQRGQATNTAVQKINNLLERRSE